MEKTVCGFTGWDPFAEMTPKPLAHDNLPPADYGNAEPREPDATSSVVQWFAWLAVHCENAPRNLAPAEVVPLGNLFEATVDWPTVKCSTSTG